MGGGVGKKSEGVCWAASCDERKPGSRDLGVRGRIEREGSGRNPTLVGWLVEKARPASIWTEDGVRRESKRPCCCLESCGPQNSNSDDDSSSLLHKFTRTFGRDAVCMIDKSRVADQPREVKLAPVPGVH